MAKVPPSYQYYPSDFDAATAYFTLEEVGAYQRLLNVQWENGYVPDNLRKLAAAARTTPEKMKEVWKTLEEKFPLVEPGRRANPRMERVRARQQAYRQKKSRAGKAGAKARWDKKSDGTANAIANGTANADGIANADGKPMALQSPTPTPSSTASSSSSPTPPDEGGGPSPQPGSSEESKTRKRKTQRSAAQVYEDPEFQEFWEAYPKKVGKGEAAKAWAQTDHDLANGEYVKRPEDVSKVLEVLELRAATPEWKKDGGQYIPNPSTWLRAAGWDDSPEWCRESKRSESRAKSSHGFEITASADPADYEDAENNLDEMEKFLAERAGHEKYARMEAEN